MLKGFWEEQPALLLGLYLLVAGAGALCWHWILLLPLSLLLLFAPARVKHLSAACIFFCIVKIAYPPCQFDNVKGVGHFSITSLKIQQSPFNKSYAYTGVLKSFDSKTCHIPCRIFCSLKAERELATRDYLIQGKLVDGRFKMDKQAAWIPIPYTFSLAELRFQAKEQVRHYLKKHFQDPRAASFLSTLITGDIDERTLAMEFSKLGLQHILSISGFHFGLLALFLGLIFRPLLPYKAANILLLCALTAYFLFVGNSPSVLRAWIALTILITGSLLRMRCTALNALGVGLVVELLLDPLVIQHIGFQLSFSATLALLLLYAPFNRVLTFLLPERPLNTLARMSPLHQHGYLLSAFVRKTLALNLAVHLFTLPILLCLFSKFPLLSLAYNLFFPLGVSLSLFLLLIAIPLPFLHPLNNAYTSLLLEVTGHPPSIFNYFIHCPTFPLTLAIATISLFCLSGICLYTFHRAKKRDHPLY